MCWINNADILKYDRKFNFQNKPSPSLKSIKIEWLHHLNQSTISTFHIYLTFNSRVQFFPFNLILNTEINIKHLPEFVN